jgi:hypothetical protein
MYLEFKTVNKGKLRAYEFENRGNEDESIHDYYPIEKIDFFIQQKIRESLKIILGRKKSSILSADMMKNTNFFGIRSKWYPGSLIFVKIIKKNDQVYKKLCDELGIENLEVSELEILLKGRFIVVSQPVVRFVKFDNNSGKVVVRLSLPLISPDGHVEPCPIDQCELILTADR